MNEAYAPLYGFSALSQGQIDQYIKMYLPIVDLRMVTLITDADDKLIAVGISMPSLSEALQKRQKDVCCLWDGITWWRCCLCINILPCSIYCWWLWSLSTKTKGWMLCYFPTWFLCISNWGSKYAESNPELELNGKVQAQWGVFRDRTA